MEPIEGVIGAIFKGAVTHNDGFDTGDDKDWVNRPLLLMEEDKDDAFHYDEGGLVIDIPHSGRDDRFARLGFASSHIRRWPIGHAVGDLEGFAFKDNKGKSVRADGADKGH